MFRFAQHDIAIYDMGSKIRGIRVIRGHHLFGGFAFLLGIWDLFLWQCPRAKIIQKN
jgi:hypothetical protein